MRLIEGGQGRTDRDVLRTEGSLCSLLALTAVLTIGIFALWGAIRLGEWLAR